MSSTKKVILTAVITFITTVALVAFALISYGFMCLQGDVDGYQKLKNIENLIDEYYIYDYDKEEMMDLALTAYTYGMKDPYTTYINEEDFSELMQDFGGNYVGIGIEVFIDTDNLITVIAPFEDSPASVAGVVPGDKIVKVNGTDVSRENYNDAINMIKGKGAAEDDNKVVLTIKRGEKIFDITVERREIIVLTVKEKMMQDKVGYIRISQFGDHTAEEFEDALLSLEKKGAKSLVIDLRNNPGGTLESFVKVADSLLSKGNIITIKDKKGNEEKFDADKYYNSLPLCVIINGNSASAAEAMAGAIADNGRGTLVGEKSFGKGVVQSIFQLGDGSAVKITTAKYYTPSGICIDKQGITPHEVVSLDDEYKNTVVTNIPYEKDYQLQKALEIVKQKG